MCLAEKVLKNFSCCSLLSCTFFIIKTCHGPSGYRIKSKQIAMKSLYEQILIPFSSLTETDNTPPAALTLPAVPVLCCCALFFPASGPRLLCSTPLELP